jgi:predicted metal-dependent hydrolase
MKLLQKRPHARAAESEPRMLALAGREIPLRVRRHATARRIVLRIDLDSGGVSVTLPRRAALSEALALANDRADWILGCLDKLPTRVAFADGARIPFMGREVVLRQAPGATRITDDALIAGGRPEHFARRVSDALKREARRIITPRAHALAALIGKKVARISVRDTRSRWGSCAPGGALSFCWRLIFAPEWVIDYVIAHEVAHLAHPNHGPKFWAVVDQLGVRRHEARAWLDANADRLQRIG